MHNLLYHITIHTLTSKLPIYFEGSPFESGVSPHPHRGFETVTFSFSGSLEHKDTIGNTGIMHSGDIQWMAAGSGVLQFMQELSEM